jgi:hypothetical protein
MFLNITSVGSIWEAGDLEKALVCLPAFRPGTGAQPQRDVLGLHRLPHRREQLGVQSVDVRLVTELRGERFEGLRRVVLTSVETPVYESLDAATEGVEECRHHQRRSDDGKLGLFPCEASQDLLQADDAADVDQNEHRGERTVDEGAVDDTVYVVEAVA